MKHNIVSLRRDTDYVMDRYLAFDESEQERWWRETRDSWVALRDLINDHLNTGQVITRRDVFEAAGQADLDRWYSNEGSDAQVYRSPLTKIARLRQTRPRHHIDISFDQVVAFRELLGTLTGDEVTDQELTDLGFSRFPAVISRLKLMRDENRGVVQEVY